MTTEADTAGPGLTLSPARIEVPSAAPFRWSDGERIIQFGDGALHHAPELLDEGYTLLSTERAAAGMPQLLARASAVHHVGPGRVDELAAELRSAVTGELLVALGGGRVIDVAKAIAAADPPRRVAAIPTTLSGAEMTSIHRHAAGVPAQTARVRPAIVINDPALSASQPPAELAASAANALGHAVEGPLTPMRNPAATAMAHGGARVLLDGLLRDGDRARLALGSMLCGYVIGATGYGLHHVLAQSLVRFAGLSHGEANAIMLPHSLTALIKRFPREIAQLDAALGAPAIDVARWLRAQAGLSSLSQAGAQAAALDHCAAQAAERPELHLTPPAASREELRDLYARAF
jgi:alcohol dehydrogenase class IV